MVILLVDLLSFPYTNRAGSPNVIAAAAKVFEVVISKQAASLPPILIHTP